MAYFWFVVMMICINTKTIQSRQRNFTNWICWLMVILIVPVKCDDRYCWYFTSKYLLKLGKMSHTETLKRAINKLELLSYLSRHPKYIILSNSRWKLHKIFHPQEHLLYSNLSNLLLFSIKKFTGATGQWLLAWPSIVK